MNKAEVLAWGVPEEKLKEFRKVYWADVRTSARHLVEKEKEPNADEIRAAINSMIQIMPDVDKLQKILETVNRVYYKMRQEADAEREQRIIEAAVKTAEAQENAGDQAEGETQPEAVQSEEGGAECP